MEIWKDILGYEGHYRVSNKGRVMSLKQGKEKLLKEVTSKWGYSIVCLRKDGIQKEGKISRMVMSAFIGLSKLQVNHKDGNKKNNHIENLEYCTPIENTRHAHRTGLVNETTKTKWRNSINKNGKRLKSIFCLNNGKLYKGIIFAAKDLNLPAKRISDIICGRKKTYRGFSFAKQ